MGRKPNLNFPSPGRGLGILLMLAPLFFLGADWPRFRGLNGSAVSADTGLPVEWSDRSGIVWKAELPGPGSSSPVSSGDRVYLTAYSGYGIPGGGEGDPKKLERHVLCIDRHSGKITWSTTIPSKLPDEPYRGIGVPQHGYASSTPVTDGERVFAFFGKSGVVAVDKSGKILWHVPVSPDPKTDRFGSGSSLVLYKDLVIVPASVESESLVAFEKKSGREKWRAKAEGYGAWWSTPCLVDVAGQKELVVNVPDEIWGVNPENGKLRWYAESFNSRALNPSLVENGGVIYAVGGRDGGAMAVRAGGRGDVTQSHVVWKKDASSYVPSPVFYEGHLYWADDRGIFHCLKADTGERVFRKRLENAGEVYASVIVADKKIYAVTRFNGVFVLQASPEFKQLAHNKLASDESDFNASPAVSDGQLLLRSDRYLYCIGRKAEK